MCMSNLGIAAKSRKNFLAAPPIFMAESTNSDETGTPGSRLRQWIEVTFGGWGSQKKAAEATGIDQGSLSKYMNDKRSPDMESILRLADAGLNVDWWLKGRGKMDAPSLYPSEVGNMGEIVGESLGILVKRDDGSIEFIETERRGDDKDESPKVSGESDHDSRQKKD